MSKTSLDYEFRCYQPADESQVLDLLTTCLGGGPAGDRSSEFFRWKHLQNPFGRSMMLVADSDGQVVGLRAFMRWRFCSRGRVVEAVRAVDTATHPAHQGRGVFSRLTRKALDELEEDVALVFNTPNTKSGPGYLKMGWKDVGEVPVHVRVLNPLRFAWHLGAGSRDEFVFSNTRNGLPASVVLGDKAMITSFLKEVESHGACLCTERTHEYLWWRYAAPTWFDYRVAVEERNGRVKGIAVFRVRRRGRLHEASVAELMVGPGDRQTAQRLLRQVISSAKADHVSACFPATGTASSAARRCWFFSSRRGARLVVKPLQAHIEPLVTSRDSWALSLGDLEIF